MVKDSEEEDPNSIHQMLHDNTITKPYQWILIDPELKGTKDGIASEEMQHKLTPLDQPIEEHVSIVGN